MAGETTHGGDTTPGRVARRDAGLRSVSRATRTAVAGGLVATGAFAALAGQAHPGTTQTTTPATDSGPTSSTTIPPAGSSASSNPSATGGQLQAPATTVQPSTRHGRVTSGGS